LACKIYFAANASTMGARVRIAAVHNRLIAQRPVEAAATDAIEIVGTFFW
jgi:hypothetical protein